MQLCNLLCNTCICLSLSKPAFDLPLLALVLGLCRLCSKVSRLCYAALPTKCAYYAQEMCHLCSIMLKIISHQPASERASALAPTSVELASGQGAMGLLIRCLYSYLQAIIHLPTRYHSPGVTGTSYKRG